MNEELKAIGLWFLKLAIIIPAIPAIVPVLVWMERKLVADYQVRIGPNRVGPYGILQPIADAVKLLLKEDVTPAQADKYIFVIAPLVALVPALMAFAGIPFGPRPYNIAADVNVALLYILALSSLNVYSLVLAGWSSNNKYSLLGGLRSSAQMISYELAMGFSLIAVIMVSGTTSLGGIVEEQSRTGWNILKFPLMFAFIVYFISGIAETNRVPFDLPEAESELVAGFHTEYSSMRFAIFFMAEYLNMVTISALATSLFFGGWSVPFVSTRTMLDGSIASGLLGLMIFFTKTFVFLYFYMWARGSWPRVRYDQLMRLGWKVMIPSALGLIIVNSFILAMELSPVAQKIVNGMGVAVFIAAFALGTSYKPKKAVEKTIRLVPGRSAVSER